jgi:succinate dehydrogenase/fumarate reductase flavoprotein subunit
MASLHSVQRWDEETDVLVLGSGLSGTVTALEASAFDADADVLLVEKNPASKVGGSSRVASGGLMFPDDVEELLAYQRALNHPQQVPEPTLRAWAEGMIELEPWVTKKAEEVGMTVERYPRDAEYPEFPGATTASGGVRIMPRPSGVWRCFNAHLARSQVRTMFDSRAVDLIQDPDTFEVFGVIVEQGGQRVAIRARRAVVMCVGGHAGSREMNLDYTGQDLYALGNPANTGDGIRMLQRAGAAMWHLRNFNQTGGTWAAIKVPDFEAAFFRKPFMKTGAWIEIARDNRRFYDEGELLALTHNRVKRHGNWIDTPLASALPVHMIFDEKTRTGDCLTVDDQSWNIVVEGYGWSPDNSAEIERGWIVRADSIRELARRIDRDPDEVDATVARYNEAARAGHDPEFGRGADRMQPIDEPPFYSIEIVAAILASTGGGKRDAGAHVLDDDGRPIPRLYEAGELGSTLGNLYQNGELLTECIVFGRIAGRNAVAETPWADPVRRAPE